MNRCTFFFVLVLWSNACLVASFVVATNRAPRGDVFRRSATSDDNVLSLTLSKPMGMILEEVEEGQAAGVFCKEVSDSGSAVEYKDDVVGAKLSTVQGTDVTKLGFDAVMELLLEAPDPVTIELEQQVSFAIGTTVMITVQQDGQSDLSIPAKVGDNLRQTLLDNGFEVYQGMKQKLGNCGGAGQCTFCAMDFVEQQGWLERSDYEDTKLSKNPKARLACLNNIQGPATIQKAKR